MNTYLLSPAEGNGASSQPGALENGSLRAAPPANMEIVPAYLRALESVYLGAMLEEVGVFDVVDHLVAMFSGGRLPLDPGRAGAILYRYWRNRGERMTSAERQALYARSFGLPCDDPQLNANTKFNELWIPFVSVVGMYSAELQVLPPGERSVGPQEILMIGRDLAINLTSHGRGLAWFAAHDFKPELQQVMELLSAVELQALFGAKDAWQLVSKVAESELGVRPNVPRGRARGESGSIIMRWLSNRRTRLLRPRTANILRDEDICEGRTAASLNKKATVYPTDSDLVTACEQWLAVTGTQEAILKGDEPAPAEEPGVETTVIETATAEAEPQTKEPTPPEPLEKNLVPQAETVEVSVAAPAGEPDKGA